MSDSKQYVCKTFRKIRADGRPLRNFVADICEVYWESKNIPNHNKIDVFINFDQDGLDIDVTRLETDEEFANRLDRQAEQLASRRETYLKLKEEFEPESKK